MIYGQALKTSNDSEDFWKLSSVEQFFRKKWSVILLNTGAMSII